MALQEAVHGNLTLTAGADLSTKQYYFVKLNSSGKVVLCSTGQAAIGVLQTKPSADGQVCAVKRLAHEKSLVVAGAAIAAGDLIASDANGKAKTAVLSSGAGITGSFVLGQAITAAAADGDVIQVILFAAGAVATTAA